MGDHLRKPRELVETAACLFSTCSRARSSAGHHEGLGGCSGGPSVPRCVLPAFVWRVAVTRRMHQQVVLMTSSCSPGRVSLQEFLDMKQKRDPTNTAGHKTQHGWTACTVLSHSRLDHRHTRIARAPFTMNSPKTRTCSASPR